VNDYGIVSSSGDRPSINRQGAHQREADPGLAIGVVCNFVGFDFPSAFRW
jgi:hypothetical protein